MDWWIDGKTKQQTLSRSFVEKHWANPASCSVKDWLTYRQTNGLTSLLLDVRWRIWKHTTGTIKSKDLFCTIFIFCLQEMLLTTTSSASLMCWLALQWDSWICKIKSFWLIHLILHFIFTFNSKFLIIFSLIQNFTFEGCSWWPIPAHPWYAGWHKNGIFEFASWRALNWYAERLIVNANDIRSRFVLLIWNRDADLLMAD